jgi:hypothetical protein
MHPEHEIKQPGGPPPEGVIPGGGPKPAQEDTRARSIVNASDALHSTLTSFEMLAC